MSDKKKKQKPVEQKIKDWWPDRTDIAVHMEYLRVTQDVLFKEIVKENMKLWNKLNYLEERIGILED